MATRDEVVTHAIVLLILDFMYPGGGHHYPLVLFRDNVTKVTNNEIPPMCPIVYHDYGKHATWVFC
jgi:hypothetical protein